MAGTGICELNANWQEMDRDERLAGLEDMLNRHLEELGYDPVSSVEVGDTQSAGFDHSVRAYYRHSTDGIVMDDGLLSEGAEESVFSTALHEAAHAMEDQDGDFDMLTEEEQAEYNDKVGNLTIELNLIEDAVEVVHHGSGEEHEDIYLQAEYWLEERMHEEGCGNQTPKPQPTEGAYGTSAPGPEVDYELPEGSDDSDELPNGDPDLDGE